MKVVLLMVVWVGLSLGQDDGGGRGESQSDSMISPGE